jgi:hypothetical protein
MNRVSPEDDRIPLSRLLLGASVPPGVRRPDLRPEQPAHRLGRGRQSSFSFMSGIETVFKGDYVKGSWTGVCSRSPSMRTLFDDAER